MRLAVLLAAIIAALILITIPRGSANLKSQPGCPASKNAFKVDYFGFPLKDNWACEVTFVLPQGGGAVFYKAGSLSRLAVDAALGLGIVLLPAYFLTRKAHK